MMRVKGVPLIVLYILICLTGIGYFVTAWQSGTLALWGYSDELVDEGGAILELSRIVQSKKHPKFLIDYCAVCRLQSL